MLISAVRDVFTDDVDRVVVNDRRDYRKVVSFARQVAPELRKRVELFKGDKSLFDAYNLEPEIDKMLNRKVWIKKGAYLVIDQTEAMVTIDVNTGRFVGGKDQERTIFEANLLAAKEIARQIRLRDIGGLIVCDFIDMYSRENRRKLFETFKSNLKYDRAKWGMNPVTDFGLIEMTRERVRPSHMMTLSEPCPHCNGTGRIMSRENIATKVERWFFRARAAKKFTDYHLVVSPMVAATLTDNGTDRVERIMKNCRCRINVIRDTTIPQEEFKVYDASDNHDITEKYMV
jgi:ribonuclease G